MKPFFECASTDPSVVFAALKEQVTKTLGTIIFACFVGSRRYGLDGPTSDLDFLVVYAAPTDQVLSIYPPATLFKNPEGALHDVTVMEVRAHHFFMFASKNCSLIAFRCCRVRWWCFVACFWRAIRA